jgi:hypothetical protein
LLLLLSALPRVPGLHTKLLSSLAGGRVAGLAGESAEVVRDRGWGSARAGSPVAVIAVRVPPLLVLLLVLLLMMLLVVLLFLALLLLLVPPPPLLLPL